MHRAGGWQMPAESWYNDCGEEKEEENITHGSVAQQRRWAGRKGGCLHVFVQRCSAVQCYSLGRKRTVGRTGRGSAPRVRKWPACMGRGVSLYVCTSARVGSCHGPTCSVGAGL